METRDEAWFGDLSCVDLILSVTQNEQLCRHVTEEEIETVIKELPLDKALGPDRIPVEFYKKCWPTVKDDFVAAVHHFFHTNRLPPQWKTKFLMLIPKGKGPTMAKDF